MAPSLIKTVIFSIVTMTAFALNSVFGRLALSADAIDPASYTTIRLTSGAMMLFVLVALRGCLLYTSPSPRDLSTSRMPSSA